MATSDFQYENQQFLVLRRFRDLPDALLFDNVLDSAAIECFLADENTIRMDWFWSNLLGGIKLCVRTVDADTASSLLVQSVLEKFDVEGIGEYQQPRCPNCKSLEVSFQGLNKAVDYTRALLGGPRPLHRSLWQCDSCAHQWPESNEKPPANFLTAASSTLLIVLAVEIILVWLLSLIEALRFAASR
jgi:ribosomal protein L37AE/L43A